MRAVCTWPLVTFGCYHPAIPTGAPCETAQDCPGDQACVGKVCGGTLGPDASRDGPSSNELVVIELASQQRDTEISGADPTQTFGDQNHVSVDDDETSLLWFDLTSIASTRTVLAATLTVITADRAANENGTVLIHRMREAWVEAEASFLIRGGGEGWALAGARPPSRDVSPVAELTPTAIETAYTIALPVDLVGEWIANPATNFGLAFVNGTATEHVHLKSRETGGTPNRLAIELAP